MILEQFPEIKAFAEEICRRAFMKRLHCETDFNLYLECLIGYAGLLTSWPVQYKAGILMPYAGSIMFPKDGADHHGPIIVATSFNCDDLEETIGHEIGHILITYYNFLYANDICFSQMTLLRKWKFLSWKIVLVDKETGMKLPQQWFDAYKEKREDFIKTDTTQAILEHDVMYDQDIQEVLCEEIGNFFVQERRKNEAKSRSIIQQSQLSLF